MTEEAKAARAAYNLALAHREPAERGQDNGGSMSEAAKEARREYMRTWRANNPERVKAHAERHWENVAARKAAVLEGQQQTETVAAENGSGKI